jgi:hypothetical protein
LPGGRNKRKCMIFHLRGKQVRLDTFYRYKLTLRTIHFNKKYTNSPQSPFA